ncbi:16S rRNA pseudouridine(516) synthase RsuA [Motiliproteus sp. SC1-56]|uniref:16S rRNA pseudouridine(516) synthase RsuA n=1 Tax=Motiliproteus sp. SC1-56 TaxID=2799565 RepID=UPI001A8D5544|nr:16S rRNA pseudouridine(516) synthase RsuA [Motiliproteus sp. SC1-56]
MAAKSGHKASQRLDRFVSQGTSLSRSQARKAIVGGRVTVDGERVRDAAFAVTPNAKVALEGEVLCLRKPLYLMLNKPAGVVSATRDGEHMTVLDLLPPALREGLHPAGRLDRDTTGLVLLSDDGDWTHRVTAPRRQCTKRYRVTLAEPLVADAEARFAAGLLLRNDPKPTRPATLERVDNRHALVSISEGRYHQVKRMFAALGNRVVALHRDRIGTLSLDPALKPGEYRPLTEQEVNSFGSNRG